MSDAANDIDKALAASSMLLAIVAIIFGAWTGDLSRVQSIKFAVQKDDRKGERAQYRQAIYAKALPLTIGAWLAAAVFAGRSVVIAASLATCGRGCVYDDVGCAFVLTELFVVLAAIAASTQFLDLAKKLSGSYK